MIIKKKKKKRKLNDKKKKKKKLWNMLNKTSFEEEIALSKLEIEDVIDLLEISTYYKMLELPYPETKEKIIEDFMEEGFIKKIYGKLAITNLGAILFAKNVHQFKSISRKSIRLIQYKDKNGNLKELTIVSLESKKDEKTGRFMMVPVEGTEKKIPAELVLIAAGFLGTESYVAKAFGVELNARTNVATAEGSYATNVKNVFVAGDNHRGQSLVVWAIREGREAAREVDESLMGYSYLSVQ